MKKALVIATTIICFAIGFMELLKNEEIEEMQFPTTSIPSYVTSYSEEELIMIDSLAYMCVKIGFVDMNDDIDDGAGARCIISICGEKAAFAGFPEAPTLLRECYGKHFISANPSSSAEASPQSLY